MTNADYLDMVENRIRGLKINNSPCSELARLQFTVKPDILARMTDEEREAYKESKAQLAKTPEQLKAEREAIVALMNENREKPSH